MITRSTGPDRAELAADGVDDLPGDESRLRRANGPVAVLPGATAWTVIIRNGPRVDRHQPVEILERGLRQRPPVGDLSPSQVMMAWPEASCSPAVAGFVRAAVEVAARQTIAPNEWAHAAHTPGAL